MGLSPLLVVVEQLNSDFGAHLVRHLMFAKSGREGFTPIRYQRVESSGAECVAGSTGFGSTENKTVSTRIALVY
jgi:hypothetical protein